MEELVLKEKIAHLEGTVIYLQNYLDSVINLNNLKFPSSEESSRDRNDQIKHSRRKLGLIS